MVKFEKLTINNRPSWR